jgi:hypothetical protein
MAHSHGLILTWNFRLVAPIAYRDASVPILSDKAARRYVQRNNRSQHSGK